MNRRADARAEGRNVQEASAVRTQARGQGKAGVPHCPLQESASSMATGPSEGPTYPPSAPCFHLSFPRRPHGSRLLQGDFPYLL